MGAADFSGYATKAGLKCSDGRTIMPDAFKHMDGKQVPLVWQHGHDDPGNVLGHAILEARGGHLYARGYFNDTAAGQNAKKLVMHRDINALSIWANQLVERSKQVFHGVVKELSLVLSGANPGAVIDNVEVQHSDGETEALADEAIISMMTPLIHGDLPEEGKEDPEAKPETPEGKPAEKVEHTEGKSVAEIYAAMSKEQTDAVHLMIGHALKAADTKTAAETPGGKPEGDLEHKEGTAMTRNVFDQNGGGAQATKERQYLSHDDMKSLAKAAVKYGSLKMAVEEYALAHGIEQIDVLFPDAKLLNNRPEFNKRRTEWVAGVMGGTSKSPFSRVKTVSADITVEEARAKGYVKGEFKKEEFFALTKRVTTPTTIYKKQKLDRDDIIDIVDLDVVGWMKAEMDLMIREEIARAILIGDGRAVDHEDKIKDPATGGDGAGIRSILHDHELYAHTVFVNIGDASSSYYEVIESILLARRFYKGTGTPTFYTTEDTLVRMLLCKDGFGRRHFNTKAELVSAMMVDDIVSVESMEDETDLLGILVNLVDYNIGADKGGELNFFDDFDIDYNQFKYLIETRLSGALTKLKAALIVKKTDAANVLVDPITSPTFVESTGVVTIPTQTGVVYKNALTSATLSAGAQTALAPGATLNVKAFAASGYYFATDAEDEWTFTRPGE
jgi:hypothetical protein